MQRKEGDTVRDIECTMRAKMEKVGEEKKEEKSKDREAEGQSR
jgi:hypothetical protein